MSQDTKKRSRKSKLTPRDCDTELVNMAVFQETTPEIQNTAKQKSVDREALTCDDFEALIDSQKKPRDDSPQLEFSVTVAVEQYDEDSSDLIIVENEDETVVIPSDSDENEEECKKNYDNTKEYEYDLPGTINGELVLNRNEILQAANEIFEESTNIADRKLSIEVRNCVGQFRVSFEDELEEKIQNALLAWFAWQKSVTAKWRITPLCYKCYICEKAWWHLHDFRQHLKKHDDFKLDLEDYTTYEVNIVAYKSLSDIKGIDFNIKGSCPKCGYESEKHMSSNRKNTSYSCSVDNCKNFFLTCLMLKTHEDMFHTASELTGELLETGKRIYCKVCSFLFYTQKSYESHLNLRHTVRSDQVVPVKVCKCYACKEQVAVGKYHVCNEIRVMCSFCCRSFPRGLQFRLHVDQDSPHKCEICDEVLQRKCVEVLHLLKHTDKFIILKKCLICTDFVVFSDYQKAFDHISANHTHVNMRYEGSNYKHICNILIPKACLQPYLEPKVEIKVEPQDCILAPELEIKQEIIDNLNTDAIEDNIQIKDEIEIHDNFEHFIEESQGNNEDVSKIFGVKIEQPDGEVKHETVDQESEYEDDIIKLDFNFLKNMQESMDDSSQDEKMEITGEEIDEDLIIDEEQARDDDSDQDYVNEKKRKFPKIYRCTKCGFDAVHKLYKAHLSSACTVREIHQSNYRCTKCSSCFDSFVKYLDHFSQHNLGPLSCPECYKTYESHEALDSHVTSHINMTFAVIPKTKRSFYYTCNICNETVEKVNFFDHWEIHLSIVENKEFVYKDVESTGSCQLNDDMLAELLERLQSPEPFYLKKRGCPICVRYFERKNDYKRHLVEHLLNHAYSQHHIHKQLKCQICDQGFEKPDFFKKHMRDHGYLRDYKCQICQKSFSDSSNYSKHIKLHNKNAYTCDICKKRFQAKISLEKHIMLHNSQKPIHCAPCKKTFYLESAYKKHYRIAHDRRDRKYLCQYCRQRFSSLKDKWDHLWYVHKERKHKVDCPKCPNSYRKFNDLKNHMKIAHCKSISKKFYKRIMKKSDDDTETLYIY